MTMLSARPLRATTFGQRRGRGAPWIAALALFLPACSASSTHSEGLEASTLPVEIRADYAVFAQRCSKCHSLARPLNSGISDENYWALYVARMRRQPGSGISQEDAAPILRFLHYYSLEQKRKGEKNDEEKNDKAVPPAAPAGSTMSGAPIRARM